MENNQIDQENKLLQLISTGDQKAFALLFRHYSKIIYPFALKLTRSEELAEEILQEVFLKIWLIREQLNHVENFGAYLNRITRNHCYNILKRRNLQVQIVDTLSRVPPEESNNIEEEMDLKEVKHILQQAIDQLTPQQRQVYMLCHQEGLKYSEVASRLNISSSTVHSHMKLALHTIRTYILRVSATILFFLLIYLKYI